MRSKTGLALLRPVNEKYLLRDEFRGARAAGAVHGTAPEPGPGGPRAVVDTDGDGLSITGGVAQFANPNAVAGDPGLWYDAMARTVGLILLLRLTQPDVTLDHDFGWDTNQTGDIWAGNGIQIVTETVRVMDNASGADVATVLDATEYTYALVLRAAGCYYFIKGGTFTNWTLLWIGARNNTATIYPGLSSYTASPAYSFVRIPERLLLPNPFAYDTFVRANGAPGMSEAAGPDGQPVVQRAWLGAGLAVDTNELKNTPTAGAEEIANTEFTVNTSGWDEIREITKERVDSAIDPGASSGGSDDWCLKLTVTGDSSRVTTVDLEATVGTWYACQGILYAPSANTGERAAWFVLGTSIGGSQYCALQVAAEDGWETLAGTFRPTVTTLYATLRSQSNTVGDIMYADAITVKPLTLSTLLGSLQTATPDVVVDAKVAALTAKTQAGIVARLDSDTNPQNCVIAYFDDGQVKVEEMSSGTWQATILDVARAFTADDTLRLDLSGSAYRLYHITDAGVATLLGSGTVTVTTGSKHGVFSTYAANRVGIVNVMPKGTGGEYEWLSKY